MRYLWIILMSACISMHAQKHDNNWLLGGNCIGGFPDFNVAVLNFSKLDQIPVPDSAIRFIFSDTNTAMSDNEGHLQFYTNGNDIYNYLHEPIKNGERLEEGDDCERLNITQGAFSVPHADHEGQYVLFTIGNDFLFNGVDFIGEDLRVYYNVVDMNANDGKGELIVRQDLMLQDTLNSGQGMVCQHANGRDWWLLLFEDKSNSYYRFLIDNNGYHNFGRATTEFEVLSGLSQVAFSADGSKYASINNVTLELGAFVDIHTFDRCSGLLSNQIKINLKNVGFSAGLAFSPNSRFLYVCGQQTLYQYDLWAEDIEASRFTIGHWDGFLEDNFWTSTFHTMLLGPDHKIYMGTPTDGHFIHVIHDPNKKGLACDFEQRGLEWPTYKHRSFPNFAYYRMGALEGSSCDTLGIDNGPIANFSYSVLETEVLARSFEDMTLREPISWSWDFGDGTASQEQHPSHAYSAYGSYRVTLETNNAIGTDTFRRNVCAYPRPALESYLDAPSTVLTCTNDEIMLNATMAGEPFTDYPHFRSRWMLGPDSVIAMNENSIRVDIAGTYRLDLLDTIYGCRIIDTIQITSNMVEPDFDLIQSADTLVCGSSVEVSILTSMSCFELEVSKDEVLVLSTMESSFSLSESGSYNLSLLDCETGCQSSQLFIIEDEPISADWQAEQEGTVATFLSSTALDQSHEWDFGDGNSSVEISPIHDYLDYGSYQVSHVLSNGCTSDTVAQIVCVYPEASESAYIVSTSSTLNCAQDSITLSVQIGGDPLTDYPHLRTRWLRNGNLIAFNGLTLGLTQEARYTLRLEDMEYGCELVDSIDIVSDFTMPIFTTEQSADTIACEGIFELYIDSEEDCFEAVVYQDGLVILSSVEDTLNIQGAGEYVLELIDCESRCSASQSFTVTPAMITADFNFEEDGSSVSYFSLGEMNVTHEWNFGDGNSSTNQNPIHEYGAVGIYDVIHIVSNACGSDTLTQTIQVISTSTNSLTEEGINVFPNPTSDLLYINSKKHRIERVRLFSSIGQEATTIQGSVWSELILSTKDLSPGVYLLDMELSNGKRLQEKVLVLKDY